jgi:disulfide oxidoreductase YuzD
MDPVTAAILTAIGAGAAKVGTTALTDAYEGLKAALRRRFGGESPVVRAVDDLEARPDSAARQAVVSEEVLAVAAHTDPEVEAAARRLLEQAGAAAAGAHVQQATGHHIAQADRAGHAEVHVAERPRD